METVFQIISGGGQIGNAKQVQTAAKEKFEVEIPLHTIREALRKGLGMRFKKIKRIPFTGNQDRSLILRQQFALNMIKLLRAGMRIINVDETELTNSDYNRQKWRVPGTTNSMPNPRIRPRISLIAGVSNHGELYISLLQVNTNTEVTKLYLTALALRLD